MNVPKQVSRREVLSAAAIAGDSTLLSYKALDHTGFLPPSEKLNIAFIGIGNYGSLMGLSHQCSGTLSHRRSVMAALLIALLTLGPASAAEVQGRTTWRDYLGNADSSHYSALKQINRSNVSRLEVAWSYSTGDKEAYVFNPLVVDDTIYFVAKNSSIVALDATTGKELWVHPVSTEA